MMCRAGPGGLQTTSLGETRAVRKLIRVMAAEPRGHDHKVLPLQDNFVAASDQARKYGAYGIGYNLVMLLPRVETFHQPADGESRSVPVPLGVPLSRPEVA